MWSWWAHLTVVDRTNIVCFILLLILSAVMGTICQKIWQKKWISSFIWILLVDLCGLILLIARLLF